MVDCEQEEVWQALMRNKRKRFNEFTSQLGRLLIPE